MAGFPHIGAYGVPLPPPASGSWMTIPTPAVTVRSDGSGTIRYSPIDIPSTITFQSIALEVTTAAAGATVELGIYHDDGNSVPGALLVDAGAIDASTTGIKTIAITETLTAGRWWLAGLILGATVDVRAGTGSLPGLWTPNSDVATLSQYAIPSWYNIGLAALPDPPTFNNVSDTVYRIMLRAS